jgi:hypothetical protein
MRLRIATLGQVLFLPFPLCSFRPFYIITAFLFAATRSVVPVIVPVIVRHMLRSTAFLRSNAVFGSWRWRRWRRWIPPLRWSLRRKSQVNDPIYYTSLEILK